MKQSRILYLASLMVLSAIRVHGYSISTSTGVSILNSFESETSYAWSVEFRHSITRHLDISTTLINEGHPGELRRDGIALEAWYSFRTFNERLSLSIGAGPYANANTRSILSSEGKKSYENDHDCFLILSVAGRVCLSSKLFSSIAWRRVVTNDSSDTDLIMLGIGILFPVCESER